MVDVREAEVGALKAIYGPQALYVDYKDGIVGKMRVTPNRVGKVFELVLGYGDTDGKHAGGVFVTTEEHAIDHFKPTSGLPLIIPGHKLIRAVVATTVDMMDLQNDKEPGTDTYKRMVGFDRVIFRLPVVPGNTVEIDTYLQKGKGAFCVDAEVTVNKKPHMIIEGLTVKEEQQPTEPAAIEDQVMMEDQIIEFAAQSAASGVLKDNPDKLPIFTGIGRTRFFGRNITPGSILIATQSDASFDGKRSFSCSSEVIDEDGRMVAQIENMQATFAEARIIRRLLGLS